MTGIDIAVIVAYFLSIVMVGVFFSRRAAKGMRSYFLGGNKLPWWTLAASGSASNYDVTGTMFLVPPSRCSSLLRNYFTQLLPHKVAIFHYS